MERESSEETARSAKEFVQHQKSGEKAESSRGRSSSRTKLIGGDDAALMREVFGRSPGRPRHDMPERKGLGYPSYCRKCGRPESRLSTISNFGFNSCAVRPIARCLTFLAVLLCFGIAVACGIVAGYGFTVRGPGPDIHIQRLQTWVVLVVCLAAIYLTYVTGRHFVDSIRSDFQCDGQEAGPEIGAVRTPEATSSFVVEEYSETSVRPGTSGSEAKVPSEQQLSTSKGVVTSGVKSVLSEELAIPGTITEESSSSDVQQPTPRGSQGHLAPEAAETGGLAEKASVSE